VLLKLHQPSQQVVYQKLLLPVLQKVPLVLQPAQLMLLLWLNLVVLPQTCWPLLVQQLILWLLLPN
jgi:hypothetical protein